YASSSTTTTGTTTPTPTPSPTPGPPPVAPGRQAQLTSQARSAMSELSGALFEAQWQMETPPEYVAPRASTDESTAVSTGRGGAAQLCAPSFPPVPTHSSTGVAVPGSMGQQAPVLTGGSAPPLTPPGLQPVAPLPPVGGAPPLGPMPTPPVIGMLPGNF